MDMTRVCSLTAALPLAVCMAVATPADAGTRTTPAPAAAAAGPFEASAQERRRRPPRIVVRPRRFQQHYLDPRAVRHCASWLEPEQRPSGTVIVPQMHCWWEPPG